MCVCISDTYTQLTFAILLKERQAVDFNPPVIISSSRHIFFLRPSKVSGKCPSTGSKLHQVISLPALVTCADFSATTKRERLQNPTPRSIPNMENFRHEARHALPAWFHGFQTSQNKTKDQEEPKVMRPLMDFEAGCSCFRVFWMQSDSMLLKKMSFPSKSWRVLQFESRKLSSLEPFCRWWWMLCLWSWRREPYRHMNLTDLQSGLQHPYFSSSSKRPWKCWQGGTWLRHCDKSGWSTLLSWNPAEPTGMQSINWTSKQGIDRSISTSSNKKSSFQRLNSMRIQHMCGDKTNKKG